MTNNKAFILGTASETQKVSGGDIASQTFFSSSKSSTTLGGKASLQPKRTPVSSEEIEAILVCKTLLFFAGSFYSVFGSSVFSAMYFINLSAFCLVTNCQ